MSRSGPIDAAFIFRQLCNKYPAKKELYCALKGLEEAFERVLRDIVQWVLSKLGLEKCLVRFVQSR